MSKHEREICICYIIGVITLLAEGLVIFALESNGFDIPEIIRNVPIVHLILFAIAMTVTLVENEFDKRKEKRRISKRNNS